MEFAIVTSKLKDGSGYVAQIDWTLGDVGSVGTPGAVKYGDTPTEAEELLKQFLIDKGHTVIDGNPNNTGNFIEDLLRNQSLESRLRVLLDFDSTETDKYIGSKRKLIKDVIDVVNGWISDDMPK